MRKRYEGLGIKDVYLAAAVKTREYAHLKEKYGLQDEEILYMGDDIPTSGLAIRPRRKELPGA